MPSKLTTSVSWGIFAHCMNRVHVSPTEGSNGSVAVNIGVIRSYGGNAVVSIQQPLLAGGAELGALVAPLVEEGLEGLAGGEAGAGLGAAGDFVEHGVALGGLGEKVGGV